MKTEHRGPPLGPPDRRAMLARAEAARTESRKLRLASREIRTLASSHRLDALAQRP